MHLIGYSRQEVGNRKSSGSKQAVQMSVKVGRKPGRPEHAQRPVTPEILERIATLWLKGWSSRKIGREVGIAHSTVGYHLRHTVQPRWRSQSMRPVEEELAKIDNLERTAWEHFESDDLAETREQLEEALLEVAADSKNNSLAVVKRATVKIRRFGQTAWLEVVEWCIAERCKLLGHYGARHHRITAEASFRVAGQTPAEVDDAMLVRLACLIAERRHLATAPGGQDYDWSDCR